MRLVMLLVVTVVVSPPILAQSAQELQATCSTLAKLTEAALRQNRLPDVVLYLRTAALIRQNVNNPNACEMKYFGDVVQANRGPLSAATTVISMETSVPVKGWTHLEVDELMKILIYEKPSVVLRTLKTDKLTTDVEKLLIGVDDLKKKHPELFKSDGKTIPVSKDQ